MPRKPLRPTATGLDGDERRESQEALADDLLECAGDEQTTCGAERTVAARGPRSRLGAEATSEIRCPRVPRRETGDREANVERPGRWARRSSAVRRTSAGIGAAGSRPTTGGRRGPRGAHGHRVRPSLSPRSRHSDKFTLTRITNRSERHIAPFCRCGRLYTACRIGSPHPRPVAPQRQMVVPSCPSSTEHFQNGNTRTLSSDTMRAKKSSCQARGALAR